MKFIHIGTATISADILIKFDICHSSYGDYYPIEEWRLDLVTGIKHEIEMRVEHYSRLCISKDHAIALNQALRLFLDSEKPTIDLNLCEGPTPDDCRSHYQAERDAHRAAVIQRHQLESPDSPLPDLESPIPF